ncbi:MAG TPA: hypothetical protein VK922_14575 [Gemmatimonadaceae bacterium]|nr:hypothetical protein [Gemmatimonadaceae bacterium]
MHTRSTLRLIRLRAPTVLFAAAMLVAGCGKRPSETAPSPQQGQDAEVEVFSAVWPQGAVVPIEVQNHHTLDLTIYVVQSGKSQRVGMATAAKSTFIRLPVRHLGPGNELLLMAHAIGAARRLQSERLVVMPGQRVVWTIDSGFRHQSSAVWE